MNPNIHDLVEPIKIEGQPITHKAPDHKPQINAFSCSTYIKSEKTLVKGERDNQTETRGALLVFFDPDSGEVKGTSCVKDTKPKAVERQTTGDTCTRWTTSSSTAGSTSWPRATGAGWKCSESQMSAARPLRVSVALGFFGV